LVFGAARRGAATKFGGAGQKRPMNENFFPPPAARLSNEISLDALAFCVEFFVAPRRAGREGAWSGAHIKN